ncbi:DUF3857 domain-containing protein [Flammeovirga sp. OC4]|uniref:DUF3857 domain-containing protein n=1 Tax=Flammeovirga sp. OC4 TaxID=1382345 RepID=UPI0005C697E1|nr:DUF3857 domain-containing protein [Flammeovirga sp. OC4]
MSRLFIGLLFLLSFSLQAQNKYFKKTPIPAWVDQIEYNDDAFKDKKGIGTQYLLISDQTNRLTQEAYYEQVYKVMDADAVQSSSDFNIIFDPSFQTIQIHKLEIIRNGKKINKLDVQKFEVIRQETNLQSYLYSGNMSAIHQLKDVRKGDIISYAFTRKGFHPFYNDKFGYTYYQNHSTPVAHIYTKLILPKEDQLIEKTFNGAIPFQKEIKGDLQILTQSGSGMEDYKYEESETAWYNGFRRVQVSTYQSWGEVVDWALPKYTYNRNEIIKIWKKEKVKFKGTSRESKILSWIHFIQDEIRYMGVENGINAYQPHSPMQVYNQRYGDCKDKSLLLVALLREENIEAYPMLVHTRGKELNQDIPSPSQFNHCIVQVIYEGEKYYIDPTISNQGGNLQNYATPNFCWGLVIKKGNNVLTELPKTVQNKINIKELVEIDSMGGGADILLRTEFSGSKADNIRAFFSNNDHDYITDEYEEFYANLYDGVTASKPVKFFDNDKNGSGKVIIEEYYHTDNIWEETLDSMIILYRVSPFVLYTNVSFNKVHQRETPYYIGEPLDYHQETTVTLPADTDWALGPEDKHVENEFFTFDFAVTAGLTSNQYIVSYNYKQDSNYVNAGIAKKIVKEGENVWDNGDYSITWNLNFDENAIGSGVSISYASVILVLFLWTILGYFARKFYYGFNPPSLVENESQPIGGWLILLAIGAVISPLKLTYDFFATGYFDSYFWSGLEASENSISLFLIVIFEFVANSISIVLSVLAIVLFFQKRTSTKYVYAVLLLSRLIFQVIDNVLYDSLVEKLTVSEVQEEVKEIGKSFLRCIIWIPYMFYSDRSKNTFTNTYSKQEDKKDLVEEL